MQSGRPGPTRGQRWFVYFLFALVTIVAVWVPFYNRIQPEFGGVPFFYWFQVAWILAAAFSTALAYRWRL